MAELFAAALPKSTDSFSASVNSWSSDNRINASVAVTLYHNFARFQLSAESETVFLGKRTQLNKFFSAHRPWYAAIKRFLPLLLSLPLTVGLAGLSHFTSHYNLQAALISAALLVSTVIIFWLDFKQKIFPYVQVQFDDTAQRWSKRELVTIVLQVTLLLVTLVKITVEILKR
jgi:hypothetical protein